MKRINFFLTNDQYRFLSKQEGTVSEHIRRAIDEYQIRILKSALDKYQKQLKISNSPSKHGKSQ